MAYAVPLAVFFMALSFLFLYWRYFGTSKVVEVELNSVQVRNDVVEEVDVDSSSDVKEAVKRRLEDLGPITFAEIYICLTFVVAILLWIFRADFDLAPDSNCNEWRGCAPGWHRLFSTQLNASLYTPPLTNDQRSTFIEDDVVAVLLALPLFLLPAFDGKGSPILNWRSAVDVPWDLLWLVGGSFSMAKAIQDSGLAKFVADGLYDGLGHQNKVLVLWIFLLVIILLSTVSSNFAMAALIVPIFGDFAVQQGVNPIYYCIPATVALSYCFILPTSTPTNMVIYSTRKVPLPTLALTGSLFTFLAWLLVWLCWLAIGQFVFKANNFDKKEWSFITEIVNVTK
eukprot:TRINITY_DN2194_c0_g2_i1.p1 TRINITY_DN2194_c0_g2~~TRINITY_DN2194_c0_g2_i1.p1  ORF type:complete len:390 (-),score=79.66 TRINITY_DN2194_c0_g2_i1:98-1120(-)